VAWKKVDLLIKAFAKVKKEYKNAELLIIGYGSKRQELEQLSINLHLEKSIKFLGGIYDPGLLGQYLLASSIYVLAGMGGLSINEAMCYNLPIICSVCDGTEKKLVRGGFNGLFFRENDEDDLAKKIMYLFANPKLRKWMGNNSEYIIRNEINIHTVIRGYLNAFQYLAKT